MASSSFCTDNFNRQSIAAIVLAGGAGRRVQGRDKGLITYQDKPLIEHVVRRIKSQVSDIIISANRNLDHYEKYTSQVVCDHLTSNEGPVAGVYAGLKALDTQRSIGFALICSCDTPNPPFNLVERLCNQITDSDLVAVVNDGRRTQNLHCLIKREAWPSLIRFFDIGGRAMHRWHKTVSSIEVDFSDQADAFWNLNSL